MRADLLLSFIALSTSRCASRIFAASDTVWNVRSTETEENASRTRSKSPRVRTAPSRPRMSSARATRASSIRAFAFWYGDAASASFSFAVRWSRT